MINCRRPIRARPGARSALALGARGGGPALSRNPDWRSTGGDFPARLSGCATLRPSAGIEDGAFRLFKSGAIVLYVAERSGNLLPADAFARAEVHQWMFAALNTVEVAIQQLAELDLFYPDERWAEKRRSAAAQFVRTRLATLAFCLDGRDYLVGSFSAADILMTSVLRILRHTDILDGEPVLVAYKERCESRPGFRKALADQMAVRGRCLTAGVVARFRGNVPAASARCNGPPSSPVWYWTTSNRNPDRLPPGGDDMIKCYAFGNVSLFAQDLLRVRRSERRSRPGTLVRVALAASLLLASAVISAGEYFERDGVALRGYDPVSYFTEGRPQSGLPAHTYVYKGSKFQFASADNQRLFAENPDKYAPQFGGFCAYGTAQGYKVSTQPDAFAVVDGKLYLNYNREVVKIWQQDVPGNIARAEKNWPEVSKTEPKD